MKKKNIRILLSTTIIFLVLTNIHNNMIVGSHLPYSFLELHFGAILLAIWWMVEIIIILFKGGEHREKN